MYDNDIDMHYIPGVVIGFVISYRAISGWVGSSHISHEVLTPSRYDRYWMGRTCWSDVIRNSRTLGRLIWFHVPPRVSAKTAEETASGKIDRSSTELIKVMAEKRMALDLIEGYAKKTIAQSTSLNVMPHQIFCCAQASYPGYDRASSSWKTNLISSF